MLAALIIWPYLGVVLYLYGASSLCLLGRWIGNPVDCRPGLPMVLVLGLATFGTLAACLSLVLPPGWLAAVLLLVGGVLIFLLARPAWALTFGRPRAAQWLPIAVLARPAMGRFYSQCEPSSKRGAP